MPYGASHSAHNVFAPLCRARPTLFEVVLSLASVASRRPYKWPAEAAFDVKHLPDPTCQMR